MGDSFTQVETRLAVEKVINPWHPQILYDLHQQGADAARIYLPPFVDPFDPNLDPLLISSINALGANTAVEIGSTGKTGVLSYGVYDFWSPLRDYIAYHNGLRILTESASANIASPINIPFDRLARGIGYDAKVSSWNFPNPWKGGEWRLGDIVDYQIDAFFSIANSAAVFRERYLNNFYEIGERRVASYRLAVCLRGACRPERCGDNRKTDQYAAHWRGGCGTSQRRFRCRRQPLHARAATSSGWRSRMVRLQKRCSKSSTIPTSPSIQAARCSGLTM